MMLNRTRPLSKVEKQLRNTRNKSNDLPKLRGKQKCKSDNKNNKEPKDIKTKPPNEAFESNMPKTKMIAKICPTCKAQVPVACKSCPCGHFFYNARRIAREFAMEADYLRRTSRVRREKPNYYDALEYDKQIKKLKKRLSESKNEEDDDEEDIVDKKESKLKKKKQRKVEEEDEDDPMAKLTPEMINHCSVILAHINCKLQIVTWKPSD